MQQKKIAIIVQARLGSSRLPGKVMLDLGGRRVIDWVLGRASRVKNACVVLAVPNTNEDKALVKAAEKNFCGVYVGSEADVLNRYCGASEKFSADTIVRLCADRPLVDPEIIERTIEYFYQLESNQTSIVYSHKPALGGPNWPYGFGVEVFDKNALKVLSESAGNPEFREHVTLFAYDNPSLFECVCLPMHMQLDALSTQNKFDLDDFEDYKRLLSFIEPDDYFSGTQALLTKYINSIASD